MATVHRFDTAAERRRWERFYAGRFHALLDADPIGRSPRDVADAHPALTRSSVEELRRGMADPPFELIAAVAEVFGVDIAYFSTSWPVEGVENTDSMARDRASAHQRQQEDGQHVDELL